MLFVLLIGVPGHAQVTIEGKIQQYDGQSPVYVRKTLHGVGHVLKKVRPKANGSFQVRYECPGIGTTQISFQRLTYRFIHKQQGTITLELDQSKIKKPHVLSKNKADHTFDSLKQVATIKHWRRLGCV